MTDRILIKDLLLRTIIGVNDDERRARQDVLINVVLYVYTRPAGASDSIEDAVNYRTIAKRVVRLVEESRFFLVEKMAAEIAQACLQAEGVMSVDVRVEKPGALRFARSVGVEIHRRRSLRPGRMHRAFISMGSNIDPELNLPRAARLLAERSQVEALSPVYQTPAVGGAGQADFLNAAAILLTGCDAARLKSDLLEPIEVALDRVRTADKYAPRTIDLDVVLFDDAVIEGGDRKIPDPDIARYPHLAVPLADIAPDYRHPETGRTLREIAAGLASRQIVRRLDVWLHTERD